MPLELPPDENCVYVRTHAGQLEVIREAIDLDRAARRLLMLVNGFTPIGTLAERVADLDGPPSALQPLLDHGLVRCQYAADVRSSRTDSPVRVGRSAC